MHHRLQGHVLYINVYRSTCTHLDRPGRAISQSTYGVPFNLLTQLLWRGGGEGGGEKNMLQMLKLWYRHDWYLYNTCTYSRHEKTMCGFFRDKKNVCISEKG